MRPFRSLSGQHRRHEFTTSFLGFELLPSNLGSSGSVPIPFTSNIYLPSVIYVLVILVLLVRFARRTLAVRQASAADSAKERPPLDL